MCEHNTLPGASATQFVLESIRQRTMNPVILERLRDRLYELAEEEIGADRQEAKREAAARELNKVTHELKVVSRNLALAESDAERQAIRSFFNDLQSTKLRLEQQIQEMVQPVGANAGVDTEVQAALAGLDRLRGMIEGAETQPAVAELFDAVDVKLFVRFAAVP